MSSHLARDLERLKRDLLLEGGLVEEAINKAIQALLDQRETLAKSVIEQDSLIDERELQIEEACLKTLALHHPVAIDLRFIVSVMKVNNDLERMGDHASNIAERAISLSRIEPLPGVSDLGLMAEKVSTMVRESLDSLVYLNTDLAREVCASDDIVDRLYADLFESLQTMMKKDNQSIEQALGTLSAARHLERIADLATNIAEDVIFLVEGEIVRHRNPGGEVLAEEA